MKTQSLKTLRVGFIGAGANTRSMHLPGFQRIEDVECAVVANRSLDSSRAVARDFGIKRVAAHWREVVEDPAIDAVCIGTWPYLHAEITEAALKAGKHVLCEARMARDLGEAREMIAIAKAHPHLVSQLVPAPFSLNFDRTIRKWLDTGKLGRLLEVNVRHLTGAHADPDTPRTWRQDRELSGKNVLTLGIFHETIQRWFDAEPDWLIADAEIHQSTRPHSADSEERAPVEIPDVLTILGRFKSNRARFTYHLSSVESGPPTMEITLAGTLGRLRFDASEQALWFCPVKQTKETRVSIPRAECLGWQVEAEFLDSIRNNRPVTRTSFEDGIRYMTFTETVDRSWRDGARRIDNGE